MLPTTWTIVIFYFCLLIRTITKAIELEWGFITSGLGLTAFAVILLVVAELREFRRQHSWRALMKPREVWRDLSNGFRVFLYAVGITLAINLVRAPVLMWDETLQRTAQSVATKARYAQQQNDQRQFTRTENALNAQIASLQRQVLNLQAPPPKAISLVAGTQTINMWLPLTIPARSTIYVLPASPSSIPWGVFPLENDSNKLKQWPNHILLGSHPFEPVCKCTLQDFTGIPILKGAIVVDINFRKPIPGKSPHSDSPGSVVKRQEYQVQFNALDVTDSAFSFYIVNQSPFWIDIAWPQQAAIILPGESVQRMVPITHAFTSVLDIAPCVLWPSSVKWQG